MKKILAAFVCGAALAVALSVGAVISQPPSSVPAGTVLAYGGASAPAGYLFCYGQAISRTTYAAAFTAYSTAYGVGDGSTTFNLPDLRGRLPIGRDDMGGVAASRLTVGVSGITGTSLGSAGGAQSVVLSNSNMPATVATSGSADITNTATNGGSTFNMAYSSAGWSFGSATAVNKVPPAQVTNFICKT